MTDKEYVLSIMRRFGKQAAEELRSRADTMTGTELLDEEDYIPEFNAGKDYTTSPKGTPVKVGEQVYKLVIPHNPSHYPGTTPETNRTLWEISHTKNPAKTKPFIEPAGTSGMYYIGEVCAEGGKTYKSLADNNVYSPSAYPQNWEEISE